MLGGFWLVFGLHLFELAGELGDLGRLGLEFRLQVADRRGEAAGGVVQLGDDVVFLGDGVLQLFDGLVLFALGGGVNTALKSLCLKCVDDLLLEAFVLFDGLAPQAVDVGVGLAELIHLVGLDADLLFEVGDGGQQFLFTGEDVHGVICLWFFHNKTCHPIRGILSFRIELPTLSGMFGGMYVQVRS